MSCTTMLSAEVISSRFSVGVEMFTAMITSPHVWRATSIGRLLAMPPSTSSRPSISTGATAPGIDMLARIAWAMRALVEDDGLPGLDVRRHRAERNGQLREALDVPRLLGQVAQKALDVDAGHDPLRQQDRPALEAELGREEIPVVVLLATGRDLGARRAVGEHLVPVGLLDDLLHLGRRRARGERAADHRPHARAGDAVHRNAELVEHLEHADVRGAARAAAGEREADARALRRVGRRALRVGRGRCERRARGEKDGGEQPARACG